MLWFMPIVILLFLYFVTSNIKRRALKYLVIMMVGWLFTLIALLAYVSELGNQLFSYLIFFPLTKILIFNRNATVDNGYLLLLLNLSTSMVVFSSFYYSSVYSLNHPRARNITNIVIVVPLVQFILYLPTVYRIQIGNNHAAFLNAICLILNLLLLLVSILVLVWHTVCCNVRIIRPVNICITLSFTCLELIYSIILLFLVYPLYDLYIGNAERRYLAIRSDLPAILLFLCTISVITVIIVFFRYSPLKSIRNHHIKIFKPINNFNNSFSIISHSLKNQLVCIDEKVLRLSYVVQDRQKVLSGVDEIRKEINDMFENISLLNSRLKMESFIMELISLSDLCHEVLDHARIIPVTAILSKRFPQEDVECFADRACLRDCLHNLLSNAVEALPEENGVISFRLEAEGNWAVITIKDNGCGIPPDNVDQIFEPFYTTKAGQKNWGIGLSICRNIVKAHGGKLYVENTSSAGTEFKLLLPTKY